MKTSLQNYIYIYFIHLFLFTDFFDTLKVELKHCILAQSMIYNTQPIDSDVIESYTNHA